MEIRSSNLVPFIQAFGIIALRYVDVGVVATIISRNKAIPFVRKVILHGASEHGQQLVNTSQATWATWAT